MGGMFGVLVFTHHRACAAPSQRDNSAGAMNAIVRQITGASGSRVRAAPPLYAALIIEAIQDPDRGNRRSLRSICQDIELDPRQAQEWLRNDPEFSLAYEQARGYRYDDLAEECLEIADDTSIDTVIGADGSRRPNKEWIQRSKVRIQTRLDLLARWDPARYGAKVQIDATTRNLNVNLDLSVDPNEAARQYSDIMRGN